MKRGILGLLAVVALALAVTGGAGAYTAAPGYAATDFATGFANFGFDNVGPVGLAFNASNELYVMNYYDGKLYKFGPGGGAAGPATLVGQTPYGFGNAAGITFSPSGRLYVALQAYGRIDEIDPANGQFIRVVAGVCSATGIATDPATGDLFAGFGCGGIVRISGYESGPATVTTIGPGGIDGITVGPDGSLYLASFGTSVLKLQRTGLNSFGALTLVANVPSSDGTAVAPSLDPNNPYIFANRNDHTVTKIDTTSGTAVLTDIFTGGSRGDFSTVGPDGCLYITQTDRIVKITNADGTCSFIPTSALPTITLAPAAQSDNVGDTATVNVTVTNVAHPETTTLTLTVTGAHPQTTTLTPDASGAATFTYAAPTTGDDSVVVTSHIGTLNVTSNTATVHWDPPLDSTAPVITPHVSGPAGDNGWYTGNTTVSWTVEDPETPFTTSGCDTTILSGFTAGTTLTCSASSLGGDASESVTVKIDDTAPSVAPVVTGTLGSNGWYTSAATISWTTSDDESGIAVACSPTTFTANGTATATCTAKNGAGLSTTVTKTVKIDRSAPTVVFSPSGGVYDVNDVIHITCTASDTGGSGLASNTCADVDGTGWALGLGNHTLSATATDNAGLTGSGTGSYRVVATAAGLCALVEQWVSNHGIANSLCAKLRAAAASRARGQNGAADNQLAAFRNELAAQRGKALTGAHADTLAALSYSL